ncbi:MAG: hypothetical protein SNJ60_08155 [Pseudanabaenaceae cyanobacterium]
MTLPYVYYIPIYPDDDCSEALMHLFAGEPNLDERILRLLDELDAREKQGEGVDYIAELERQLNLKRLLVRHLPRDRAHFPAYTA